MNKYFDNYKQFLDYVIEVCKDKFQRISDDYEKPKKMKECIENVCFTECDKYDYYELKDFLEKNGFDVLDIINSFLSLSSTPYNYSSVLEAQLRNDVIQYFIINKYF